MGAHGLEQGKVSGGTREPFALGAISGTHELADPCAQFGPRFRPEGFLAGLASGLYVPEMSGAKAVPKAAPDVDGS